MKAQVRTTSISNMKCNPKKDITVPINFQLENEKNERRKIIQKSKITLFHKHKALTQLLKNKKKYNRKYQYYVIQLRGKFRFYIKINRLMFPLTRSYCYCSGKGVTWLIYLGEVLNKARLISWFPFQICFPTEEAFSSAFVYILQGRPTIVENYPDYWRSLSNLEVEC